LRNSETMYDVLHKRDFFNNKSDERNLKVFMLIL
jgi:hypothetical protein